MNLPEFTAANVPGSGPGLFVRHWGLGDLIEIYDDLEHGAELMYEEQVGVSRHAIDRLVRPKTQLTVFQVSRPKPKIPDYSSGEVLKRAEALLSTAEES